MPVERNIGSTLVDTRPVIRTTAPIEVVSSKKAVAPTNTLVDAKEFSLDTVEAVGSKGPYGQKCLGPCVQQCLPPPPSPRPPGPPPRCG